MPTRRKSESFSDAHIPTRLDNIRVVLVRTFHPGNIGSVARAMKTMGLTDLCLVSPRDFPSEEATKMALSADDILENAAIVQDLPSAIHDCKVVIASTARIRGNDLPELTPQEAADILISLAGNKKNNNLDTNHGKNFSGSSDHTHEAEDNNVAIVLGPERMGLHNDDIQYATHRVTIPTSPQMQSLNIAAAAQTLCYEVYKRHIQNSQEQVSSLINSGVLSKTKARDNLANRQDHERFYTHLEETIKATGFLRDGHGGPIMLRLRALFARAEPDKEEINILRAILASVDKLREK
jgi:tRNA (cytidine32/uridine32-2'-O)-methyltransferase